jgi:hypothetical protein
MSMLLDLSRGGVISDDRPYRDTWGSLLPRFRPRSMGEESRRLRNRGIVNRFFIQRNPRFADDLGKRVVLSEQE